MTKCKIDNCDRTDIKSRKLGLCSIHYARWYRKTHKEQIKPVSQARYLRNRRHNINNSKRWHKEHMDRVNVQRLKYERENPILTKIRNQTRYYFGHLKKESQCKVCGIKENLEFHHFKPYDYRNFIILCGDCHREIEGRALIKRDGNAVITTNKEVKE
jgi:hypothetical protein